MKSMLKDCLVTQVMNPVAAGTSEQKSSVLNMAGYDSVMFILSVGTVTAGAVITATAKENTANSTSSPTPTSVTNGSVTLTDVGGASSNSLFIVDVVRPTDQYVFLDITRTTANVVINSVVAIQYNSHGSIPVTQGSTVSASGLSTPEV